MLAFKDTGFWPSLDDRIRMVGDPISSLQSKIFRVIGRIRPAARAASDKAIFAEWRQVHV
jgi:hypothetical protein